MPFSGNLEKLKQKIHISRGNTFQVYARSLRGVDKEGNPHSLQRLNQKKLKELHAFLDEKNIKPVVVHAPYFYNLAQEKNVNKALEEINHAQLMMEDLEWATKIEAPFYILQPGYYKKKHPVLAIEEVKSQLFSILEETEWTGDILIKNMAGAGTEIGSTLEEWNELISFHPRVKGALDLARIYASGYDFTSEKDAHDFYLEIEEKVGWEKIHVLYINDSNRGCGSKKNNFVPLGEGSIGFYGYEYLLKYTELQNKIWIVENQPKPSYYDESIKFLTAFYQDKRGE